MNGSCGGSKTSESHVSSSCTRDASNVYSTSQTCTLRLCKFFFLLHRHLKIIQVVDIGEVTIWVWFSVALVISLAGWKTKNKLQWDPMWLSLKQGSFEENSRLTLRVFNILNTFYDLTRLHTDFFKPLQHQCSQAPRDLIPLDLARFMTSKWS